jgi:hypothetical protein
VIPCINRCTVIDIHVIPLKGGTSIITLNAVKAGFLRRLHRRRDEFKRLPQVLHVLKNVTLKRGLHVVS